MPDIAFDKIRFGMKPEEITEALIQENPSTYNKSLVLQNKEFKKPLQRKILGISHSAKLVFNKHNNLQELIVTSDDLSFAHCLQEADFIFGTFTEHYVFDNPEKNLNPMHIVANYKVFFLTQLIRLRKDSDPLPLPIDSPPETKEIETDFSVVCNEHAMGKRNYKFVFNKRSTHLDVVVDRSPSRFSMSRLVNRDR